MIHATAGVLTAADQTGTLKPGLSPTDVSPGTVGFVMTLIMVVLVILLALDHTRRQRRMKHRFDYAMEQERARAEGGAGERGGEESEGPSASV